MAFFKISNEDEVLKEIDKAVDLLCQARDIVISLPHSIELEVVEHGEAEEEK